VIALYVISATLLSVAAGILIIWWIDRRRGAAYREHARRRLSYHAPPFGSKESIRHAFLLVRGITGIFESAEVGTIIATCDNISNVDMDQFNDAVRECVPAPVTVRLEAHRLKETPSEPARHGACPSCGR
jgi:hypothetical protein